jgi:pilus assembly protein Flp/PilA
MSCFRRFIRNESAATAIEYGLIAAGIFAVIVGVVTSVGGQLTTTFTNVSNGLVSVGNK